MNKLTAKAVDDLLACYVAGYSIRLAGDIVGVGKCTVSKYYRNFNSDGWQHQCECGREAGHSGWCVWRFQQSAKRQGALKKLGYWSGNVVPGLYDREHKPIGFWKGTKSESSETKGEQQWLTTARKVLREVRKILNEPLLLESLRRASRRDKTSLIS